MKIGIDCRLWNETGVGRYIRNLISQLYVADKVNNYILFVLSKDYENLQSQISPVTSGGSSKWKIVRADIRWHTLEEQMKLPQVLNRENLDLMHFPYFSVPFFYHRPFVVTIHDLIVNHFPTGKASALPFPIYNLKLLSYEFIVAQAAKNAKKIIAVSSATKNEIIDHLKIKPSKIEVVYEGVENKVLNSKLQKSKIEGKFYLYVGNAYPHKNLERLLEAFKTLDSDIKLVLVGRKDYFYERLKKMTENMNLSKKVVFLQNVGDLELSNLYKNASALIMPSLMEGFGLPALEAMANKCLVLASGIPALQEICGEAAIYFDPYSVKDISEKMRIAQGNNNESKKEKGVERAKQFSWQKTAKETLKIYENSVSL